ncbi:MAG: ABC transporter ATP-binding protein/permease [Verrucomicrobiae bacterium]|nr:ABC transporter ATP-binding protein/permease [Verrucomicrobiae bacterium]
MSNPPPSLFQVWKRALAYFHPDWPRFIGVCGLMLATIGANLIKPWPVAWIVDGLLGQKALPAWLPGAEGWRDGGAWSPVLLTLVGAVLAAHLVHSLLSTAQNYLAISMGLRGLRRVRNAVFACLQRLSLRFHQRQRLGDLIYRAAWDTYAFQTLFQQGLITTVSALLSLVFMVVVMVQINGRLTLVALVTAPLMVLAIRLLGRRMYEQGAAAQQADSAVVSLVQQNLQALPLVQSYTREDREQETFVAQTEVAQRTRLRQHAWELLYWLGISGAFGLGVALTVWLGASQVMAGQLTIGQLWVFLAYLGQLYDPLNQLSHAGVTLSTAGAAAGRVFELLDTPEEVKDAPDARPAARAGTAAAAAPHVLAVRGRLEFDGVSFGYEPGKLVLKKVSFGVEPGQRVAIIGPSGAGKTTLMNLIPRFFDPQEGAVRLEGEDLRRIKLRDLRSLIAVVLQEPVLLPSSIADNIAYGRPGATMAEIEAAARAAGAHDFIVSLPQKYQTPVGDGGARLSTGERQRLNLARAFLKDAPLLLLDEPTSALDAENEALVVRSLFELMRGRTTLMIAHRLSTIQKVDRILVLQNGEVTEWGTPEELRRRPDSYYARVISGQVELA